MSLRFATMLVATLLALQQPAAAAERVAVLVTNDSCPMASISNLDVRKAYLGIGVSHEGATVRAFRLTSDEKLNQIFLQSVVAMSERTYERRLLSALMKYGRPRPQEYKSIADVVVALNTAPCGIVYMWERDANAHTGVKVIKILWRES